MLIMQIPTYFFPEQMSSSYQYNDLLDTLSESGYDSIIYAPTPTRGIDSRIRDEYKRKTHEKIGEHIEVYRFRVIAENRGVIGRAIRYIYINVKQYLWGRKQKNVDLIFGISTPPTQGLVCGFIKEHIRRKYSKHVAFVYRIHDVFPDSLVNAKLTSKGSILWKVGRWIENKTYSYADKIIAVSESIQKNLIEKGVPQDKIEIVPDWIDLKSVYPVRRTDNRLFDELRLDRDSFVLVYAGNMGKAQGAGIILNAAERLIDIPDLVFVVFGGGVEYPDFVAKVRERGLSNVLVQPLMSKERISEVYSLGNYSIVSCKPGTGAAGMPSKTWYSMACGTPVIASFDTDSELARIIDSINGGFVTEAGNSERFTETIRSAYQQWKKNSIVEVNFRDYVVTSREKTHCLSKMMNIFKEV